MSGVDASYDVFVPGRLCILGEHTDWAGGYRINNPSVAIGDTFYSYHLLTFTTGRTVVCCTNEGINATCRRYEPRRCYYGTDKHAIPFDTILTTDNLAALASDGGFYAYVAGTLLCLIDHEFYGPLLQSHGLKIDNYRTTLPMKKGLSSSAAICVLVVRCFAAAYQIAIPLQEVMSLAYHGEMRTPSRCGRMDQCVALGAGGLALMEFTGDASSPCSIYPISIPTPLYLVVADLHAGKDTVVILRTLNSCYPTADNETQLGIHIYAQNNIQRIAAAYTALTTGDVIGLGAVMIEAQQCFDRSVMPVQDFILYAQLNMHTDLS